MKSAVITGLALVTLLTSSCRQQGKTAPAEKTKEEFIPVADYIKTEIKAVDSLPVGILKREISDGRSDSSFITPAAFDSLAANFLPPELNQENFQRTFTESSFLDETTGLLTFHYETRDSASSVRRVDVLMPPSLQMDKVNSVYIEKVFESRDTAINQKLYWKPGKHFQIITEKITPGGQSLIRQMKVIWDPLQY